METSAHVAVPSILTVVPFVLTLLAIAVLPLVANHWWEHNRNKAIVAGLLGVPMMIWLLTSHPVHLGHSLHEYASFIVLLGSLYAISGGIVIRGNLAGTPGVNSIMLAIGALLASFIGTTGASMLLIRPMLRANAVRRRNSHVFIFFIFIVSNIGGLLTPLGDPPLFLGFLRGVPFFWTMKLFGAWAAIITTLLVLFYIIDSTIFRKEDIDDPKVNLDVEAIEHKVPIHIGGKLNFLWLGGVVVIILLCGTYKEYVPMGLQEAGMLAMAIISMVTTKKSIHKENHFEWSPIIEVAVLFIGIFITMVPALMILNARGGGLGLTTPSQFFWGTGILSSFLDNAPTYLTFGAIAAGLQGTDASNLGQLLLTSEGEMLLRAISLGAVFMGANTYIGNGPNFMVKAMAEKKGVKMPGFFGYMVWSGAILIPVFGAFTLLFF